MNFSTRRLTDDKNFGSRMKLHHRPGLMRQVFGAIAQYEKAMIVMKLRGARNRKKAKTGRCEGRKPVPAETEREAKRLARRNPKTGRKRSLRQIAEELARLGYKAPTGSTYHPQSVKRMLAA